LKNSIPFGYEKNGELYLSGWADHKDRKIGEVREDNVASSITFFVERFENLKQKIDEVTKKIDEAENKGSFLMKLLHLKDQLTTHDGIGDYSELFDIITKYESLVTDIIQKNRERNFQIKTALIEEAKVEVEAINWKEGTEKVNDLKARWIKTGNAEGEKNDLLEKEFWELIKGFFDRKKNFYEDKHKLIEHRKKRYEELVKSAQQTQELYGSAKFQKIKELRTEWKEVGGVPSEIFKPLVEQFNKHLIDKSRSLNDYPKIIEKLESIKEDPATFNKAELDKIKKNVFRDKAKNPNKGIVLEFIQLLVERDFINKLSNKRFPKFAELEAAKKKSIRAGIIKDLLARDKEELKVIEENSHKFTSSNTKMNKLVESKLKGQHRKIEVKEKLKLWVENNEF
jgi:hypothetical protein